MAKTTRNNKRKRSAKYKPFIILFIVLIAIVVASIAIGYYYSKEDPATTQKQEKQQELLDNSALEAIKTPLEGSWVSNYDGTILTFNGLTFTVDKPSVDKSISLRGTIAVEQNLVTFMNLTGEAACKNIEGHYQFSIEADEIFFELIKDNCDSRKERMTMSWFKL